MILTAAWFVGSLVGGVILREIVVERIAAGQKLREPAAEIDLRRLGEMARVSRAYVPSSEFLLSQERMHELPAAVPLRPRPPVVLRAASVLRNA